MLDALEIEQAVLCGVSVGGVIAQAFAFNYPDRVRALVLCETGARHGSIESWRQRIEKCEQTVSKRSESLTMERWFSPTFGRAAPPTFAVTRTCCCKPRWKDILELAARCETRIFARPATVRCPTLVLCGAEDIATPPGLGRELAELISGAQFSLIENAAHLPCIEQPDILTENAAVFSGGANCLTIYSTRAWRCVKRCRRRLRRARGSEQDGVRRRLAALRDGARLGGGVEQARTRKADAQHVDYRHARVFRKT